MNQALQVKPDDFPVLLLLAALGFELLRRVVRRRALSAAAAERWTLAAWFVHPWAAWAALNLVFRWRSEDGFNNRATFPFFANPWVEQESWREAALRLGGTPGFWAASGAALLAGALAVLVVARCARAEQAERPLRWLAALLLLGALLPAVFATVPAGTRGMQSNTAGPLAPWFKSGGTMLHCMPFVKGTDHYLRNFEAIQPRLRISIHGLSHPPLASLSLHALGRLTGAAGTRESVAADRLRYAVALTLFNALGVAAVYLLGAWLFASARVGLIAAALWTVKPAALAHNTFAQDGVYAVFFILALALSWRVVTDPRRRPLLGAGLGAVFFVLTQLTFSWCIVTTLFALFAAGRGWRQGWCRADWALRLVAPLAVLAVLFAGFCAWYRLDYLALYRASSAFVAGFYKFQNPYQWSMALAGGQLAMLLMLGSLVASLFCLRVLPGWLRTRTDVRSAFCLLVLALYLVPVLVGPACLKMETERCWSWVAAVALCGVAGEIAGRPAAARLLGLVAATNLAVYYGMRLFVCVLS